jgi:hypothetical protein
MGRVTWNTNKVVHPEMLLVPYLRPGQFELRWPQDCAECGVRMAKGEAAGFAPGWPTDVIVCDDCYA